MTTRMHMSWWGKEGKEWKRITEEGRYRKPDRMRRGKEGKKEKGEGRGGKESRKRTDEAGGEEKKKRGKRTRERWK